MPAPQALLSPDPPTQDNLPALRLVPVPEVGPPFDGDPLAGAAIIAGGPPGCGLSVPVRATGPGQPVCVTERPRTSAEWPQQFARLLAEALAGARPVRQILPWTSDRAHVQLRKLMPLFGGGQRPRVLRVITTRPTREVIEMTVIVGVGTRTRALAVRLERAAPRPSPRPTGPAPRDARQATTTPTWVCTDIEAA